MGTYRWFPISTALALHDMMISMHGGDSGVRDMGLLESALMRPQNLAHYESPTLTDLAASYAAGVVWNHPFIDGNKRTGFMLATMFLERNGAKFNASQVDAVLKTLALSIKDVDEPGYAAWLAENTILPK